MQHRNATKGGKKSRPAYREKKMMMPSPKMLIAPALMMLIKYVSIAPPASGGRLLPTAPNSPFSHPSALQSPACVTVWVVAAAPQLKKKKPRSSGGLREHPVCEPNTTAGRMFDLDDPFYWPLMRVVWTTTVVMSSGVAALIYWSVDILAHPVLLL